MENNKGISVEEFYLNAVFPSGMIKMANKVICYWTFLLRPRLPAFAGSRGL